MPPRSAARAASAIELPADAPAADARAAAGGPVEEDARAIAAARRALAVEAAALGALADGLDQRFARAVDRLMTVSGRVVVTGMGKSGHVARKIAATLASTGTPAFFVHPSEASHGDLGMVARDDALIALSNSGDTAELADLLAYARRFGLPVVAITGRVDSTLGEHADIVLELPDQPEACPMGLAPTTSTTLMMALGDALAIALLDRRGFSAADYRVLHPGGALGRRLVTVEDIMHAGEAMPLIGEDTRMAEAILTMTAGRFGCVGIVGADGALAGIITDGDLRRHMADDLLGRSAAAVMTATPRTIRAGALAAEALGIMNDRAITSLFVVDDRGVPAGIVHIHDCLRAGVA
ncbi:MAG: KpsF/GutQ family sugar-phosphate isomerase [Azospirillaceae bacterium]